MKRRATTLAGPPVLQETQSLRYFYSGIRNRAVCGELLILGKLVIRHTHVRKIELFARHCEAVVEREPGRGLQIQRE